MNGESPLFHSGLSKQPFSTSIFLKNNIAQCGVLVGGYVFYLLHTAFFPQLYKT